MNHAAPTDPLAQLEGYLAQDPGNAGLRAEAFDTALRTGRPDRAETHLQAGLASGRDPLGWRLRQAHALMARHDWDAALAALAGVQQEPDAPAELIACAVHDQALIALRRGQAEQGLALLQPLLEDGTGPAPAPALQALWLRLLHHAQRIDEAVAAATGWAQARSLHPEAAGVAALAALDAGNVALGKGWAEAALAQGAQTLEALVARASVALGEQLPDQAKALLAVALRLNPEDGRARSAWGFAELLQGQLAPARQAFERAVQGLPEHIGTWHGLGWAALLQGDLPAARQAFEQSLALDRNFAESHGGVAAVHARAGEREAAQASIDLALRLDRACLSAHYAQAVLEGRDEDTAALQRLAQRLLATRRSPNAGQR